MTITFVTRRKDHKITDPRITVLHPEEFSVSSILTSNLEQGQKTTIKDILDITTDGTGIQIEYPGWFVFGHDIEYRGGFPSKDKLLLSSFHYSGQQVLTIDNTSVNNAEIFSPGLLAKSLFIAHNADAEAKYGVVTDFLPEMYGCTMVNSQRLLAGQEGFRYDIISELKRCDLPVPVEMDKDIRSEFANLTFFEDRHILYNASDTVLLKEMYYRQLQKAHSIGQTYMMKNINSRLVIPIAQTEIRGFRHDRAAWIQIAKDRQEKAEKICKNLNEQLVGKYGLDLSEIVPDLKKKKLQSINQSLKKSKRRSVLEARKLILEDSQKTHLKAYALIVQQLLILGTNDAPTVLKNTLDLQEQSLTDETPSIPSSSQPGQDVSQQSTVLSPTLLEGLNYNSNKQLVEAFKAIGCPLPLTKDKKTRDDKPSFKKDARNVWLTDNSDSPYYSFFKEFDTYKKTIHNVNAFGEKWVDKYTNPLTGRVHTSLRQAGADTGRMSSGNKDEDLMNAQQIPSGKEYRETFIADEGRVLITADYSNCEGVVMGSQARELAMLPLLSMADSHSWLGTKAWRAVYDLRYKRTGKPEDLELAQTYEMNQSTEAKKKERSVFKNSGGLFPVAYGVAASKVAGAAKVTIDEGQAMINAVKAEVPGVIAYLDGKSKEAVSTGYVVHNKRTNSRRGFTAILDHLHYRWPLDKSKKVEVEMAARNSPIQGTNSDLMKEAIIFMVRWAKIYRQDIMFMLTVHDELVVDAPEDKGDFYAQKIGDIMARAAKLYLEPEFNMVADVRVAKHWKK
jgi:hypothetical protein